mmetsp:Transcript_2579/g.2990  ORF Transcript_2579/g.2990 Transcript_2579/m.2990 type:complete len:675 (-) Transcript_2579:1353-3377(-)
MDINNLKRVPPGSSREVEIEDSGRCALLVIDVQEYCSVPGVGYHKGVSRSEKQYFFDRVESVMVPNIERLLKAARKSEAEVIFTVIESLTKDGRDSSLDYKLSGPLLVPKGSRMGKVLERIEPSEDDIIIPKTSCSVFQSTNLDYVLRNLDIKFLVVVGQLTNQCVESAVRDAADLGYLVTVVEDACAANEQSIHEGSLVNMSSFARVKSTSEIVGELEREKVPSLSEENFVKLSSTRNTGEIECSTGNQNSIIKESDLINGVLFGLKLAGVKYLRHIMCDNSSQIRGKALKISTSNVQGFKRGVGIVEAVMGLPLCGDVLCEESTTDLNHMLTLVPDLSSLTPVPYSTTNVNVYGYLCKKGGRISDFCPRGFLKRMITAASDLNLGVAMGVEIEFQLMNGGSYLDDTTWASISALDNLDSFLNELDSTLEKQGVEVLQIHAESAPGQFEVVLGHSKDLMKIADNILTTRQTIRALATKNNFQVEFTPKPSTHAAGNGQHVHVSCEKKQNSFMAGVLAHLPSLCAVVAASCSSYDRLKPGCWAGSFLVWAEENKEAPIRLCENGMHFECKTVDNTCNPYLAIGCLIAAGVSGVKQNQILPPKADVIEASYEAAPNLKVLPQSLSMALDELKKDTVLEQALGRGLFHSFLAVKRRRVLDFESDRGGERALLNKRL